MMKERRYSTQADMDLTVPWVERWWKLIVNVVLIGLGELHIVRLALRFPYIRSRGMLVVIPVWTPVVSRVRSVESWFSNNCIQKDVVIVVEMEDNSMRALTETIVEYRALSHQLHDFDERYLQLATLVLLMVKEDFVHSWVSAVSVHSSSQVVYHQQNAV